MEDFFDTISYFFTDYIWYEMPQYWFYIAGGVLLLLIAGIVTLIVPGAKAKKRARMAVVDPHIQFRQPDPQQQYAYQPQPGAQPSYGYQPQPGAQQPYGYQPQPEPPVFAPPPEAPSVADDDEKTVSMAHDMYIRLCLRDMNDPTKYYEMPIMDHLLIGKDPRRCHIVINYSRYISGVHCEVLSAEQGFVVRDGGADVAASTNGTFVDEQRADTALPLMNGSVLRLGDLRFKVTYR